jgi:Flp pilus assembly protein TadD
MQGNFEEAITYLDKALAIDPNDKVALDNKQIALKKLNNPAGIHFTTML